MGKIIVSTNMSLDGFVQDPDGTEGSATGNWFAAYGKTDLQEWARLGHDETLASSALLLGRRTDEWFAKRWINRPGDWAEAMNALPKYVVSSTIETPAWSNAAVIEFDSVATLKASVEGDILVYGSYSLVQQLLSVGLVDELRLFLFPVLLGEGLRLFGSLVAPVGLRLVKLETVGETLLFAQYQVSSVD